MSSMPYNYCFQKVCWMQIICLIKGRLNIFVSDRVFMAYYTVHSFINNSKPNSLINVLIMPNQSNAIAALIVSTNGIVKIMIAVQQDSWTLFWKKKQILWHFSKTTNFSPRQQCFTRQKTLISMFQAASLLVMFCSLSKMIQTLLQKCEKQGPIQIKYIFSFPILRSLIEIYRVLGLMYYW